MFFFFFVIFFFFFNDTATTEIYTLSLHDALPISQDSATTILRAKIAAMEDELRSEQDKLRKEEALRSE